MKWFAVKTLYRSEAHNRPEKPDLGYDPDATSFEERILLIKARTRSEAVVKAEREARNFATQSGCVNPYGQHVITRYMGYCDLVELKDHPGDKVEIFNTHRIVNRRISDRKLGRLYAGKRPRNSAQGKWRKFINRDYHPQKE